MALYQFAGQAGAYLDNRLPEKRGMEMRIGVSLLVGVFVVVRAVVLGGPGTDGVSPDAPEL